MVDLRSLRLLGRLLNLIDGRLPPPLEEVVVVVLRRLLRVRGFLARREGEILVANLPQQPLLLLQVRERLESTVHLAESCIRLRVLVLVGVHGERDLAVGLLDHAQLLGEGRLQPEDLKLVRRFEDSLQRLVVPELRVHPHGVHAFARQLLVLGQKDHLVALACLVLLALLRVQLQRLRLQAHRAVRQPNLVPPHRRVEEDDSARAPVQLSRLAHALDHHDRAARPLARVTIPPLLL
mmetsp:Transcript_37876/g.125525  ORF Transcript_37876/g.125525 Transcript_37876/m.125525 type:complete len:237 (+) Transcript_37876:805-1515(+)